MLRRHICKDLVAVGDDLLQIPRENANCQAPTCPGPSVKTVCLLHPQKLSVRKLTRAAGRCNFDQKHGFGILTEADGSVRQGIWFNGELLE